MPMRTEGHQRAATPGSKRGDQVRVMTGRDRGKRAACWP